MDPLVVDYAPVCRGLRHHRLCETLPNDSRTTRTCRVLVRGSLRIRAISLLAFSMLVSHPTTTPGEDRPGTRLGGPPVDLLSGTGTLAGCVATS
jgi:hypothetical protein